ncbi:MAG: AMP-binding protein [Myxococcales bacterium]|nr:AMP-binding protein [Myxococcales bacterium]
MHALLRAFRERPSHTALRASGTSWSYSQLETEARRHAAGLMGLGLEPGARVAVLATPAAEVLVALLGQYLAGLVHVPINTRYRGREIVHILRDSGAAYIVVDDACADALEEACVIAPELRALPRILIGDAASRAGDRRLAEVQGDPGDALADLRDEDLSLMIYTSGTTGASKGVAHTHASVTRAVAALIELWRWRADDALVLALPLFHVHGLAIGVHGALLRGMTIELQPGFDAAAVVDAIARGGTIFMGVPTMYRRLLEHIGRVPGDAVVLGRARLFTSGSAALPAVDFERFAARTGHRILERYGMSETLFTLSNPYAPEERVPGSVGFAVPGFEVRVVDEDERDDATGGARAGEPRGELWVRGVGLMREYWGDPDATARAFADGGWFRTGDIVTRDQDGRFRIVGRSSVDIIKSGGFKISARELEEVLLDHEDIAEVAVVGVPDLEWGQRIVAAVVPRAAVDPDALARALIERARQQLAAYKQPRAVAVVDALPRNALGKLQKHVLIDALAAGELTPRAPGR